MKKKIWVHKARSFEDAERFDTWFWRRAGASVRFEAAWSMVSDFLKMGGNLNDQLRLKRIIQRVKHLCIKKIKETPQCL